MGSILVYSKLFDVCFGRPDIHRWTILTKFASQTKDGLRKIVNFDTNTGPQINNKGWTHKHQRVPDKNNLKLIGGSTCLRTFFRTQ